MEIYSSVTSVSRTVSANVGGNQATIEIECTPIHTYCHAVGIPTGIVSDLTAVNGKDSAAVGMPLALLSKIAGGISRIYTLTLYALSFVALSVTQFFSLVNSQFFRIFSRSHIDHILEKSSEKLLKTHFFFPSSFIIFLHNFYFLNVYEKFPFLCTFHEFFHFLE